MKTHEELHKKMNKMMEVSEESKLNFIVNKNAKSKVGIITSGASFNYVIDGLDELKIEIPVMKLGFAYPLPENKIKSFIKNLESVLIVEELEPVLEEKTKAIAKEVNPKLKINGKNCLPIAGELSESMVIAAICKVTGKELPEILQKKIKNIEIAKRLAVLCSGCPHRATFYAAKIAGGKDTVYAGDIGCYILGIQPPLEAVDFLFSMGASQGLSHGIRKVTDQKVIAFIGDSTFFHAGIPGLINIVYNKSNPLIIILDNRITAMTGHQPHPGTGKTGIGEGTKEIKIEEIVKACGVENIKIVDPFNFNEMVQSIKEFLQKDKVSVIIARRECRLLAVKDMKAKGIKVPKFMIDKKLCRSCGTCLLKFGCPAIVKEGKNYRINEDLCTGCSVCPQVCPNKAIKASA
jgi:indolepyruvate ferredoxin oxidoreductase alpha subunit